MQDTTRDHLYIEIRGARERCLKNISVDIPQKQITVVAGISGSGKTSLIINTLYQKWLLDKTPPSKDQKNNSHKQVDVDSITGAENVVFIDNKNFATNYKSIIGTATGIYQLICKLYSLHVDEYDTNTNVVFFVKSQLATYDFLRLNFLGKAATIFAIIFEGKKLNAKELLAKVTKLGFSKLRINGEICFISASLKFSYSQHYTIEVVIDKFLILDSDLYRLSSSLATALKISKNYIGVTIEDKIFYFSQTIEDLLLVAEIENFAENIFSFLQSPGSCQNCNGTGEVLKIDIEKLIPNKELSIAQGAIGFLGRYRNINFFHDLNKVLFDLGHNLNTPIKDLSIDVLNVILYGDNQEQNLLSTDYPGILSLLRKEHERYKTNENYCITSICPNCDGSRIKKDACNFKIQGKSIAQLLSIGIQPLYQFVHQIYTTILIHNSQKNVVSILSEICKRLRLLIDLALGDFSLNTPIMSLSGGEYQRIKIIRYLTQGANNDIFILDEPSIGLSNIDSTNVIKVLQKLRDLGNTIIIIEHNAEFILNTDYLIIMGPGAGQNGGEMVVQGFLLDEHIQQKIPDILISRPLNLPIGNSSTKTQWLKITHCKGNNLKDIDLVIPLNNLVGVTGLSGSGKSSLISYTLLPALKTHCYNSNNKSLPYTEIIGFEHIEHVVEVEQYNLGKSGRSIVANYIGFFSIVKNFFVNIPLARLRGYNEKKFSYSVVDTHCTHKNVFCCKECLLETFGSEILAVKYKHKSIADILFMSITEGLDFFSKHLYITNIFKKLEALGLGYLKLNQNLQTLSSGELQRLKLATALAKGNKKTLYIFDEPSVGLQLNDIYKLLTVFQESIAKGNSILVVEHNNEIIKFANYFIELGPGSGPSGGKIMKEGYPRTVKH